MFTQEQLQEYGKTILYPTHNAFKITFEIPALYIIAAVIVAFMLIINIFKNKYSIFGYAVMLLSAFSAFILIKLNLFPLNFEGIWANALRRMYIPFFHTYKYLYWYYYGKGILKYTITYFFYYFCCPMCLSLGSYVLSTKKRVLLPWVITYIICFADLAMLFFDATSPGDVGIFAVATLGLLLGKFTAKLLPSQIKDILPAKEREVF